MTDANYPGLGSFLGYGCLGLGLIGIAVAAVRKLFFKKKTATPEPFEKRLETNPQDVSAWIDKGRSLYQQKNLDEAIACFEKALEINPKLVDAWLMRGLVFGELNKPDQEIASYDKILEIDRKHFTALYNKGMVLQHSGKIQEAIDCWQKILKFDRGDQRVKKLIKWARSQQNVAITDHK